jgi:hypothetical protein
MPSSVPGEPAFYKDSATQVPQSREESHGGEKVRTPESSRPEDSPCFNAARQREDPSEARHGACSMTRRRCAMTHTEIRRDHRWLRTIGAIVEHAAAVVIGFVMMVIGLGLGVTMIMLPVGIVVGLLGVALFVAGLFARVDKTD